MQLKVYEITWGETQTATGTIAGNVVSYDIAFSDQGVQGQAGPTGMTGPSNVLNIGTVTTGAAGSNASATITGTSPSQTLNLTVPRGNTGATGSQGPVGPANSLTIGAVTTGAAGSSASAAITGAAPNQTLSLTIPQGLPGTGLETLTTQGDTLYRGATTGERLPIGSTGQVLKVSAQGLPSWANESGAVTSVNGLTGAVDLNYDNVGAAPIEHALNHESGNIDPIMATAAYVVTEGGSDTDGVYFWDGETLVAGRPTFFRVGTRKNTQLRYVAADQKWKLFKNDVVQIRQETPVGEAVDRPWLVQSYDDERDPVVITSATVTRLGVEDMVQLLAAQSNNISTTTESGLLSSADKTKLDGIASGAEVNVNADWNASSGDAQILNKPSTFAPSAHASSHFTSGSDPLAPSDIGAQSLFASGSITGASSPSAARAIIYDVANFGSAYDINLPITNSLQGDIFVFRTVNLMAANVTIKYQVPPSPAQTVGTLTAVDQQLRFIYRANAQQWDLVPVDTHTHPASAITSGTLDIARIPTGTSSTQVSLGNHSHGNINSSGQVGSTSGLPLVTTTAGAVTTLALGTAGQVLTVNSGATGVEFAAAAGGGVTGAASSASDVLGVSGANITAVDAGSDKIVFWDDSASALKYLEAGSGLSISGTTLTATSTFNPASPDALGTTTPNTGAFTSLSTAPAANTAAFTTTGYSLTGTNAQSLVDLAGTWNTSGTPSAFKLNITDTASNASSLLMQLQTGGADRFTIAKNGTVTSSRGNINSGGFNVTGTYGGYGVGTSALLIYQGSTPQFYAANNNNVANFNLGFSDASRISNAAFISTGTITWNNDTILARDAADTLAQYRGTNAQEKRLYGTFTSSTNYQRMTIKSVKQTLSALSGASATTTGTFIPDGAVVVGVTTRVATLLTGAAGYTIGDGTDADRWGDITGTAIGTTSDNRDWTAGTIECFTAGGNVTLTAKTSNFTAGAIEICVFYLAGQAD